MNRIDRYKILVRYVVSQGIAENQRDLGRLMGYNNESSFSQIINEKVERPKEFMSKLKAIVPGLNPDWVDTGVGEMIISEYHQSANGNNIQQIGSNSPNSGNNSNNAGGCNPDSLISKALDEIAAQRALTERSQKLVEDLTAQNNALTTQLLSLIQSKV